LSAVTLAQENVRGDLFVPVGTATVIGQFRVEGRNGYSVKDQRQGAVTK